jgi:hypothetical protein
MFLSGATIWAQQADVTLHSKATPEQQKQMYSRLKAAEQERISNYGPEIPRRAYEDILHELDSYDYPADLRWQAWDGYGLSLIIARDKKAALQALQRAIAMGGEAGGTRAQKSRENLRRAQAMN